jgi:hypothetical protein
MCRDGTPHVGVLAPHTLRGLQSSAQRMWRLGFHVVAYVHLIAPLAPPLIFIEHTNGLPHRRLISTII